MDKSILDVVHDSAKNLHAAGAMKEVTLREFDAMCLPQVKELTAVQKWEQGQKKPNGPSQKLLNLVAEKGLEVLA